jgi:hypothetical protein
MAEVAEPSNTISQLNNDSTAVQPSTVTTETTTTTTSTDSSYIPIFKKESKIKKDQDTEDSEYSAAKAYLSTKSVKEGISVYDHLTSLVEKLLETKPSNAFGKLFYNNPFIS